MTWFNLHWLLLTLRLVREVLTNERNLFDICAGLLPIHVSREVANMRSYLNNEDDIIDVFGWPMLMVNFPLLLHGRYVNFLPLLHGQY